MIKEIVFISLENWDEIWRRNQFICDGLARRNADLRILFVAPAKDLSNAIRTGKWKELTAPQLRELTDDKRIACFRPWKCFPNTFTIGRLLNERLMRWQVQREALRRGFRSPLLWINDHSAVHMISKVSHSGTLYDITDDWTTLTQSPRLTALIEKQDAELCREADAVVVCSERLREMKTPLTSKLHLVPNGVDSEHYAQVDRHDLPLPAETLGWQRPVLGYTGSIHGDRVDLSLVEALARKIPQATVALVGPVMLSAQERERLEKIPNIILAGPKPYSKIPDYMRAFDVCMTPHLVTPFTESLNPIKLWEYLAAGKPIISTRVAGFRDFPEFVYLADDAEAFSSALEDCLREAPQLPARRRAVAREHSWQARLDSIEEIIENIPAASDLKGHKDV